MTNWTALIPARLRTTLYIGFGVLSLAQTAVLAYTAAVGLTAPLWAVGGGAVLGVIGGAFGFVAAGNTDVSFDQPGRHEATDADWAEAALMVNTQRDTDDTTIHSGNHAEYPVGELSGPTQADPERYTQ